MGATKQQILSYRTPPCSRHMATAQLQSNVSVPLHCSAKATKQFLQQQLSLGHEMTGIYHTCCDTAAATSYLHLLGRVCARTFEHRLNATATSTV